MCFCYRATAEIIRSLDGRVNLIGVDLCIRLKVLSVLRANHVVAKLLRTSKRASERARPLAYDIGIF